MKIFIHQANMVTLTNQIETIFIAQTKSARSSNQIIWSYDLLRRYSLQICLLLLLLLYYYYYLFTTIQTNLSGFIDHGRSSFKRYRYIEVLGYFSYRYLNANLFFCTCVIFGIFRKRKCCRQGLNVYYPETRMWWSYLRCFKLQTEMSALNWT